LKALSQFDALQQLALESTDLHSDNDPDPNNFESLFEY